MSFNLLRSLCVLLALMTVTAASDLRRKRNLISIDLEDQMTDVMRELKKGSSDDYDSRDEKKGAKSSKGSKHGRDSFMSMSMTFSPTFAATPVAPPTASPMTSLPVTGAPGAPPCDREPSLLESLSTITPIELLEDPSTPQGMAYDWLLNTDTETDVCTYASLEQRYAMATLYYSTGGSTWLDNTGWLSSSSECTWALAACDGEGALKSLELAQNELSGSITPEFSVLSTLSEILFYNNQLTGKLPSLTDFTDLLVFDLEVNFFSGPAFGDLSSLGKLEKYLISDNALTGTVPDQIGSMTSLQFLWMLKNQISGRIPPGIGGATSLENIYASENQLTGSVPNSMSELVGLKKLRLDENKITGSFPAEVAAASTFEDIRLFNNTMTGQFPEFDASALSVFWIKNNRFDGTLPAALASAPVLRNFLVGNNTFIGTIPPIGAPTLQFFDVRFNLLSGDIPSSIFASPDALEAVYLQGNSLTGTIPDFSGASVLVDLYLSGNALTGTIPEAPVGSLPAFEEFLVDNNDIEGTMPQSICALPSITDLWADCAPPAEIVCDCCTRCFPEAE